MPLWFVVVCAVMGVVLALWDIRKAAKARRRHRRTVDQWNQQRQRWRDKEQHDRAVFEAIARGRR